METTYVYTDGSVSNNVRRESRNTFGGIGAFFGEGDRRNVSEPFFKFPITNQRTEIQAASKAIENFMKDKIAKGDKKLEKLVIYTDSMYLINLITKWIHKWKKNRWKTVNGKDVKNKDLIFELDHLIDLYKDWANVEFRFVGAHKDAPENKSSKEYKMWYGNKRADELARRGTIIAMKAAKERRGD